MRNAFTEKLRKELLSDLPTAACCRRSFLCGLLINGECGLDGSVYIRLTGRDTAETAVRYVADVYGIESVPEYTVAYGRQTAEWVVVSEKLSAMLKGLSDAERISQPPEFFRCDECYRAFIAGMLLSAAAFCNPEKETRVELSVKEPARASKLSAFFQAHGLFPGLSVRKGMTHLLFKRNEDAESLIAMSGAGLSAMDMIQAGLIRDLKKDVQRVSNCEVSNLASAARASVRQLRAIAWLRENGMLISLDADLRATADLREQNPEDSLGELCLKHNPPISKSGLSHRLERIVKIYEKYTGQQHA